MKIHGILFQYCHVIFTSLALLLRAAFQNCKYILSSATHVQEIFITPAPVSVHFINSLILIFPAISSFSDGVVIHIPIFQSQSIVSLRKLFVLTPKLQFSWFAITRFVRSWYINARLYQLTADPFHKLNNASQEAR